MNTALIIIFPKVKIIYYLSSNWELKIKKNKAHMILFFAIIHQGLILKKMPKYTHSHTHTHIYVKFQLSMKLHIYLQF